MAFALLAHLARRDKWVGWVYYFSQEIFLYKKNDMYLLLGKLRSKLLDVKCINLNLPLISIRSSIKQINTCLIILKL